MIKKGIIILLFLISSINLMGQGFTYSYADPCTLKTRELYIPNPNGNVALFYGGQTRSFTLSELQSGAVQQWINQVNSTNPSGPCSGVGLLQNTTLNAIIAQNTISVLTNVISTLSDVSSISDMSMISNMGASSIEGIIQVDETVSSNNGNGGKDNKKKNNNGTTNNTNGTQTTSGGVEGQNNVQTNQTGTQQVGGNNSSQGATVGSSNNTTTGGEQTSQSSVTNSSSNPSSAPQVSTNNPSSTPQVAINNQSSNPVTSGNQVGVQTTNNQGNNSVSSSNPVTSGNNSTPNTNNSTTSNTNNSTSNQNSQNGGQNNQNSPVVSVNQNSQGQNTTNSPSNNGGVSNITGGVNSVKADVTEKNDKEDSKQDVISSAESSVAESSSSTKNKVASVKKGSLMMTGDIVTISSASGVDPTQVRINASVISSNTKNTIAKGALINFTSQINNSNLTLFFSYRHKRFTSIIANSMMLNFEKDFFNTVSLMQSYQYKKLTTTVGVNLTTGNIGESKFQSISTLGGFVYNFKVNKKFGMTTMFVMVYSPFVYYYEGLWYQSGLLAVPFTAIDYKITKKFKLNLSFSGVNQINDQTLNYQVLIGAKAFL